MHTGVKSGWLLPCVVLLCSQITHAQDDTLANRWVLDEAASTLRFQSTKNETTIETSEFTDITGSVDEEGRVSVSVELDSIDTGVDLLDVRMRFLFFETFRFPKAFVTTELSPESLSLLTANKTVEQELDFTLKIRDVIRTCLLYTSPSPRDRG